MMRFDEGQMTKFMTRLEREGNPSILLAPIKNLPVGVQVPDSWRQLLASPDAHRNVIDQIWEDNQATLPELTKEIQRSLQAVGLVHTATAEPSLIYLFTKKEAIYARRGFVPATTMPAVHARFSVDLTPLYKMHNGWIDLVSADTGPLPTEDWYNLGDQSPAASEGLSVVFRTGGNVMGFNLEQEPAAPHILWSGGKVETVTDFWEELDGWLATGLEDKDSALPVSA